MTRPQPPAPWSQAPDDVAGLVVGLGQSARRAVAARLATLLAALDAPAPAADEVYAAVERAVGRSPDRLWLAHAVLAGTLPTDEDMADLLVRARLGGTWAALLPVLSGLADQRWFRPVEVVRGAVLCDVHTTVQSTFLSGIQRVVRETTSCWTGAHGRDLELVGWDPDVSALRRISAVQRHELGGPPRPAPDGGERDPGDGADATGAEDRTVVVPWECTFLWVEVVTDLRRTSRLLALTQHSRNEVGVLGYDSIPITSSSTVAAGMTAHFARSLAAVRRADRVALISAAAAEEFRGVMAMGAGRRDPGPEVAAVPLAVSSPSCTEDDLVEARAGLTMTGVPMVLVVGSHEPRKNHVAVLHAAELLWREGLSFNLVLVGAGSWGAAGYDAALASLLGAGRPVQSIRGLPDRLLWAAYRLAHVTVFPSLNEGFGLPVAESLAAGTPVITSAFGSMRDIVAPDGVPLGGLLVDPRDDRSLTDALRRSLIDPELHARLVAETSQHPPRTWEQYAAELWDFLVDAVPPADRSPGGHPTSSS